MTSATNMPEPTALDLAKHHADRAESRIGLEGLNEQGHVAFATMYAAIAQAEAAQRNNELFAERNRMLAESNEMSRVNSEKYQEALDLSVATLRQRAESVIRKVIEDALSDLPAE